MSIKLTDAAKFFENLPHQIDAFEWLQGVLTAEELEQFAQKYRQPKAETFPNTWDGVFAAGKQAGAKFPEVVAAQWALESSWGKATSGKNNFFGLKGSGTKVNTQEFINGQWITIQAGFIDFPDLYTCVCYLVDRWYKDYSRYQGINRAQNRDECAQLLIKEGYATDPGYATKLIEVMNSQLKDRVGSGASVTKKQNPLPVIYMSQRDNYRDAARTCFSSSCAMLLKYLKPNSIKDDNNYLMAVFSYGDSTDSNAQLKALAKFGVNARFVQNGNRDLIKKQIDNNKPVPAGFLHHGTATNPTGSGHWLCIIGYDDSGYWVNDPWGECDLISGTYINSNGNKLHYSYKNFEPRWLVEGPNTGWCIVV